MAALDFYGNSYGWLKSILDSSHDAIIGLDLNANILKCNNGVTKIYGYTADEIIGKSIYEFIPKNHQKEMRINFEKAKNGEVIAHYEGKRLSKKKSEIYVSSSLAPIKNHDDIIGVVAVAKDFTHIKNMEQELLEQNLQLNLIKKIFDNAHEGMIIVNKAGIIKTINPAFEKFSNYSSLELVGKGTSILKSEKYGKDFYKNFWSTIEKDSKWTGELWIKIKGNKFKLFWVTINLIKNNEQNVSVNEIMYVAVFTDLTERIRYENKLKYQALHDSLTGLPNRFSFQEKLIKVLDNADEDKKLVSVCFLDLDGFKDVNDRLGHDVGDILLKMVSNRLKRAISRVDFVARLGGDEFTIIIYDFKEQKNLDKIAQRIINNIGKAYRIRKNTINVSVSMGIAMYPHHGKDAMKLMKKADISMYNAKNTGKNRYVYYSDKTSTFA